MTTRLIIGGRTFAVSAGFKRKPPTPDDPYMVNARDADKLPQPPPPPPPTTYWEDTRYGVKFPILDVLQPESDWVSASTMLHWYSCNYDMLMQYVKNGWVSCALSRTSSVRRFRVLDPKSLVDDKVKRALKRK